MKDELQRRARVRPLGDTGNQRSQRVGSQRFFSKAGNDDRRSGKQFREESCGNRQISHIREDDQIGRKPGVLCRKIFGEDALIIFVREADEIEVLGVGFDGR